jgi:transcriptional repressor NrdR
VRDIEGELRNRLRQEVRSSQIGELALRRLKEIDPVAYVRFASVYRAFADVDEFEDELARLEREPPLPRGQYPLDDQLFQTLDDGVNPPPRATLTALPGGREGAEASTTTTTKER